MTIVLKLIDGDGEPLALADDVRPVLLAAGERVATGVRADAGVYTFDCEAAPAGLTVRLEAADAPG